ncbi:hypothetical protein [Terrihabitans rhizophilus]|uniref:Uncharacterized protein n=1 Tax=Terrihabitans rhizophilus TaxID=3092662 RepID=A0ABU4RQ23_9HYPH|nr:hypothetical protein [Terrihabitans sp. PJ23]MDX6806932.1 hypothetical protein [Terrihabitans sp. PJ23]
MFFEFISAQYYDNLTGEQPEWHCPGACKALLLKGGVGMHPYILIALWGSIVVTAVYALLLMIGGEDSQEGEE